MKPSPLRRLLAQRAAAASASSADGANPEYARARALIAAIDAGGIPLSPAKVNQIAREMGLEVSREAPVAATVARIRALLSRA